MRDLLLLIVSLLLVLSLATCPLEPGSTDSGSSDGHPSDPDPDPDPDPQPELSCPDDMVLVPANPALGIDCAFCIDKYEASRADATATHQGSDASIAVSQAGVIPWYVNPMSYAAFEEMQTAAAAAGKRICSAAEWTAACSGSNDLTYAFGDVFDPLTCNCVDSFCAEYCDYEGIAPGACDTGANCGHYYFCYQIVPTGDFAACQSADGVFDLNGNVWEVVSSSDDARGYEVRGGAFNEIGAAMKLQCDTNATWTVLYAGFRCCKDAE